MGMVFQEDGGSGETQDRILQKLGIEPSTPESFRIFIASLKTLLQYSKDGGVETLKNWSAPILCNLDRLSSDEVAFIESELPKVNIPISECQIQVQKVIPQDRRKRFAAYYTIDQATRLMAWITHEYLKTSEKERIVLADPFLGSAYTLTTAIRTIGTERLKKVWGVEPLALPALVAFASLLDATKGKKDTITVISGDAFNELPHIFSQLTQSAELPKADIILTNPPFTRWMYLQESYRAYLLKLMNRLGYKDYITRKEASLQTLSMFLSDQVLNNGGLLVSVLPSSTFYTIYGEGYKSFLRKNYKVLAMVESVSRPSFSEDSGFKEVILLASKSKVDGGTLTLFARLNNNFKEIAKAIMIGSESVEGMNLFNIHELPQFLDINWLALFGENKLRNIVVDLFEQGLRKRTLAYWEDVIDRKSIIRGVEMYGPEFFFIPNKHWKPVRKNKRYIEIENIESRTRLALSKEFLIRTLRRPGLYDRTIRARVYSYMLSIPPLEVNEFPKDLQDYIRWGVVSNNAKPAINAYDKYWYSHVHKQMMIKQPFGRVFIPDKVDLTFKLRGVFANYSKEKVAASKNFYIVKDNNEEISKLLVGWFNSTIFLSTLVLLGRRISETWTRFLENDYLELPLINLSTLAKNDISEVCETVDSIMDRQLPPLWDQLNEEYRYRLDMSIAEAIRLDNPKEIVGELHHILLSRQFNTQSHKT